MLYVVNKGRSLKSGLCGSFGLKAGRNYMLKKEPRLLYAFNGTTFVIGVPYKLTHPFN